MSAFIAAYAASRKQAHVFPKTGGWRTVHQVAKELRIAPARVSDALRPCIMGPRPTIERRDFTVWSPRLKKVVRASGYRVIREVTRAGSAS